MNICFHHSKTNYLPFLLCHPKSTLDSTSQQDWYVWILIHDDFFIGFKEWFIYLPINKKWIVTQIAGQIHYLSFLIDKQNLDWASKAGKLQKIRRPMSKITWPIVQKSKILYITKNKNNKALIGFIFPLYYFSLGQKQEGLEEWK